MHFIKLQIFEHACSNYNNEKNKKLLPNLSETTNLTQISESTSTSTEITSEFLFFFKRRNKQRRKKRNIGNILRQNRTERNHRILRGKP